MKMSVKSRTKRMEGEAKEGKEAEKKGGKEGGKEGGREAGRQGRVEMPP